jgi:predicted flavoprotein YhiN
MTTLSGSSEAFRHFRYVMGENLVTLFAFVLFFAFVFVALFGGWLAPHDPMASNTAVALKPPSWQHWFGTDSLGREFTRRGEFVATETGLEGSLIYAASSWLREEITRSGSATLRLDLLPDKSAAQVLADVSHPRGSRSLSSHLKSRLSLEGIKAAILHELLDKSVMADAASLAVAIKALPVTLVRPRPIDEAISSAGGVCFSALSVDLQLQGLATAQAVFCAGEMLDWEAPTGGYLMTACMASGRRAGQGVLRHLGLLSAA